MANEIFDRDTILDLTVNIIPLGIIAFFVVGFAVFPAFGFDPLTTAVQYGLLIVPFVFLAILTYLSGKAIAGDEQRSAVYLQGQATVEDTKTLEEYEEAAERAAAESDDETPELTESEKA
ncbi:DUF6684 family protein [Halogeometricum limi]|uniref:Cox cluster protein n=1 Tax=Halogeometricum limi TaxID=555875 RepID=A0A1I6GXP3_9EURY|nr:DUF6684 family protein [Halogeometricum limi]SFR46926.1 hypothetical protein SAMN04488124_1669 [Halogeometricum limi]